MRALSFDYTPPSLTLWQKVRLWQLLRQLRSADPGKRILAITKLGGFNRGWAVELLVTSLADHEAEAREVAREVLGRINSDWPKLEAAKGAVPKLIAALKDDYWEVRQAAARALAEIKDSRAVKPLVLATLRVDNWMVRSAAVEALAEIGDPRAIRALEAALKHQNAAVQKRAAEALKKIDPNWGATEEEKKKAHQSTG